MDQYRQGQAYLTAEQVDGYYEQLVTSYWHQLSSFVQLRTSNQQDTEDIVQEAFVHAYYALNRYSMPCTMRTYP